MGSFAIRTVRLQPSTRLAQQAERTRRGSPKTVRSLERTTIGRIHGFIRDAGGTISSFDASSGATYTEPESIDAAGEVAGLFADNLGTHGFIRTPDGQIVTLDVPNAAKGTEAWAIDKAGRVTGDWTDQTGTTHGFLLKQ